MEGDVKVFVADCLYCADYPTGGLVPRPLSDTVHGKQVGEVIHFDFLHLGDSNVADGVDTRDGFRYVLVIVEDVSGYVWLRPARKCEANFVAKELVEWCSVFGRPTTWVSDNAAHFKNRVIRKVASRIGVTHRFSVANSAWTNGTVERMMREVLRTTKAILNERRRPLSEWIVVLPAVQSALNAAWRQRLNASPFQVMMGRRPPTSLDVLVDEGDAGVQLSPLDGQVLRDHIQRVTEAQECMHARVIQRLTHQRQQRRERASRGELPHFTVGDYVLVARVRKQGKHPKLMSTWTGPWRIENDDREHVYNVSNIVTGETREAHVTRMRLYADNSLNVTAPFKEVFQHIHQQGEYHIRAITGVRQARMGDEYVVQVQWEGLEDEEGTWEFVSQILEDAPTILRRELRRLKPPDEIKSGIKRRYKINI